MPKVTVLMPVFNGEKYLREAIESILNQTFTDFEFLIINDGSTDSTVGIINSYNDSRIRLIHNDRNAGLIVTLNKGFDLANGEYIVRMDCDDISMTERIEKQVHFMDSNLDVGVCGTWFQFVDTGQKIVLPEFPDAVKAYLFYNSALGHPTVIIRTDVLRQHKLYYDSKYKHAEDYELWIRLSKITKLANIPEVLLQYRKHPEQISVVYSRDQGSIANVIRINQLKELGLIPTQDEIDLHLDVIANSNINDFSIFNIYLWFRKLISVNIKTRVYDDKKFKEALAILWLNIFANKKDFKFVDIMRFLKSPLRRHCNLGLRQKVSFSIKCFKKIFKR